jgi:hypothetical protein
MNAPSVPRRVAFAALLVFVLFPLRAFAMIHNVEDASPGSSSPAEIWSSSFSLVTCASVAAIVISVVAFWRVKTRGS